MRIIKIHLFNFRSVEDLTFNAATDGMHLIYGAYGTGKSSFLTGVRFALFGDNGQAGNNLDLRRRGSADNDDAGCEVTFTHGQDTIVARRWLRRSNRKTGPVEKGHASLTINGRPVDGITPTKLTQQIEEILGMNAKAFTSAAMIPQGEVATLMTAPPSEVQELVERHTGLDQLTRARDTARKTAREAQTKADSLPGDPERVWELEDQLGDAAADLEAKKTAETTARERCEATAKLADTADGELTRLRSAENAAQTYRQNLAAARERCTLTANAVTAAEREAHDAGINLDSTADDDRAALAEVDQQMENIVEAGRAVADTTRRIEEAAANTASARTAYDTHQQKATQATADSAALDDKENQLTRDREAAEATLHDTHRAYTIADTTIDRLDKAIAALEGQHGNGHTCPTCNQEVDHYDALVAELRDSRAAADHDKQQAQRQGTAARQESDRIARELAALPAQRATIERTHMALENAQRDLDRAQAAETTARDNAEAARAHLHEVIASHHRAPGEDPLETGRAIHRNLTAARDSLVSAANLRQRLRTAQTAADTATRDMEDLENSPVHAPGEDEITAATQRAADRRGEANDAHQALTEAVSDRAAAESAHNIVAHQLREAKQELDYKDQATREATVAKGEADVLAALRSDLLAEYTANICRAASDMLAGFGGEYVAFHLDDDFVPRAELTDGTLVRTAILSGGESALIGLAFRIGLTLTITGGGLPEQIIGDEVTNYLDEEGRRMVLSLLNQTFTSVILISHTDEAQDYASETHAVERVELGTTRWVKAEDAAADTPDAEPAAA